MNRNVKSTKPKLVVNKVMREVPLLDEPGVIRTYKDSIFRMVYKKKEDLLSLYNAFNHTQYTNVDDLEINTLENAIYMNVKNDVSFVFNTDLSLYEHQSTYNPNLPLRDLFYVAKLLQGMVKDKNIYSSTPIKIPMPQFVVFYNGVEKQPERQVLKLSDLFEKEEGREFDPALELQVLMLNINPGYNEELKRNCKSLHDYMVYVEKVRTYEKEMGLEDAVERAITECIEEGVLVDLLSKHRAEAKAVSIFEYDQEKHMRQEREEWLQKGEERVNTLHQLLIEKNRLEDLQRAVKDKDYQQKLFEEFGL